MSNIIITILIIWFLAWIIQRRDLRKKGSFGRTIIADKYLILVADTKARQELLEEIEDDVEEHIKIEGMSRTEAEYLVLAELARLSLMFYSDKDANKVLAHDQLMLCIEECFPRHLNSLLAYQKRVIKSYNL